MKCWGRNVVGQLGRSVNPYTDWNLPVDVTAIVGASAITAGANHSCALLTGATIKCWGDNGSGQLGDGTFSWNSYGRLYVPVTVLAGV